MGESRWCCSYVVSMIHSDSVMIERFSLSFMIASSFLGCLRVLRPLLWVAKL